MVYGFIQIFILGVFGGFWLIIMGSFLRKSAKNSFIQTNNEVSLSKINVRDILNPLKLEIPFDMLINDALREYFVRYKKTKFPVVRDNKIIGMIDLADIKKLSLEQRSRLYVEDVQRKLSEYPSINMEDTGKEAMRRLVQNRNHPYIVVVKEKEKEDIIGFIEEQDIYLALKFCELNPESC